MKNVYLGILLIFLTALCAVAKPKSPFPMTRTQPDGTSLTVRLYGDESFSFITSTDGYLLLQDSQKVLYYADEKATISSYKARNIEERSTADNDFLKALNKEAIKTRYTAMTKRTSFGVLPKTSSASFNLSRKPSVESITIGSKTFLVLLVNSSNIKFTHSQTEYSNQLNEENYSLNGHSGSVRDYLIDQSSGLLIPTFDVHGPVTLSNPFSSYSDAALIKEAMQILDDSLDFSVYDNDNDGEIDVVAIITAGTESDNGGHGIYKDNLGGVVSMDSRTVNKFLMTPELSNYGSRTKLDGMGSFTHEFGHILGLKDLYQLRGSGSLTPGYYDVMDIGCYNGSSDDGGVFGTKVPNYSAFQKQSLGWLTPIEVDVSSDGIFVLPPIDSNEAYTISTSDADEWFLLENRQQSGWDTYIPGKGMLIWHIDYDKTVWWRNALSEIPDHQYVDIEEASTRSTAAYPFPGTRNITNFSNFITWDNTDLNKGVYNITESNGVLCFTTDSSIPVTNCTLSSSSASSSSSESVATLTKHGAGSVTQSVVAGSAITSFSYAWTNASSATVTGMPDGITVDINANTQTVTISGSVAASAAEGIYDFTVSTVGATTNATATGAISVTASSTLTTTMEPFQTRISLNGNSLRVSAPFSGEKVLQLFDLSGHLIRNVSFYSFQMEVSLASLQNKGIFYVRLSAEDKLLHQQILAIP